jgi:hypothetical protein
MKSSFSKSGNFDPVPWWTIGFPLLIWPLGIYLLLQILRQLRKIVQRYIPRHSSKNCTDAENHDFQAHQVLISCRPAIAVSLNGDDRSKPSIQLTILLAGTAWPILQYASPSSALSRQSQLKQRLRSHRQHQLPHLRASLLSLLAMLMELCNIACMALPNSRSWQRQPERRSYLSPTLDAMLTGASCTCNTAVLMVSCN